DASPEIRCVIPTQRVPLGCITRINAPRGPLRRVVSVTSSGIAYDCLSPHGGVPVLFLHAGVADRRMWDPQWEALAATWDVARLDLRGFGFSDRAPTGPLSEVADVLATMDEARMGRVHLVGASL